MELNVQAFALLAMISFVVMQFIEALVKPITEIVNKAIRKEPVLADILGLWPVYLCLGIGAVLGWYTGINGFTDWWPDYPVIGRLLTGLAIGLGPTFVYDLTHKAPQPTAPAVQT